MVGECTRSSGPSCQAVRRSRRLYLRGLLCEAAGRESVAVAISSVGPLLVVAVAAIATLLEVRRGPLTKRDTGEALALGFAMVAMMMPVIDAWAHARSNGAYVGGLLPFSDGRAYHEGALHLLHEGALNAWDQFGARYRTTECPKGDPFEPSSHTGMRANLADSAMVGDPSSSSDVVGVARVTVRGANRRSAPRPTGCTLRGARRRPTRRLKPVQ
jgi:hypothetical protein